MEWVNILYLILIYFKERKVRDVSMSLKSKLYNSLDDYNMSFSLRGERMKTSI